MKQAKKKFSYIYFSSIFLSTSFFFSCSSDLEVNAPYQEITVVYGLLSQNDKTHFIKINKSFLGEAGAYTMAAVRDSSEYKILNKTPGDSAIVEEWKDGATTGRRWILVDSTITNKESGDFYYPKQTVYFFSDSTLDATAQYHLNISLDGGAKTVTAQTELINDITEFTGGNQFNISCSGSQQDKCLSFASSRSKYIDKSFAWRSVKDGKRYQLEMNIYYKDSMADGSGMKDRKITWTFQPPLISSSVNGNEDMSMTIKGEDFYKEIGRQLTPLTDATILRRYFDKMEFTIYVAGDDFNTYLLANEPSTGIIQEKQPWDNIENGIGIFSTRYAKTSPIKLLDVNSLDELVGGQHTFALKFCRFNLGNQICD